MRSDALKALQDEKVLRILPKYVKIVNGEFNANFQILKRIEFKPKKSLTSEELWEVHNELMKKFYVLRKKLDFSKVPINIPSIPSSSLLDLKIKLVEKMMEHCELCERKCGVNRLNDEKGECRVGNIPQISSEFIHMGEEAIFVPSHTIFFMGCNFHCQFCQNWPISQWFESGVEVTPDTMARWIENRKKEGCRNVNFVGGEPTPDLLWILQALKLCNANQSIVWNSNFYMSEKNMKILEGIVDVYLSDFKYGSNECADRLSKVTNYTRIVKRNHRIATEQTELVIRHLILPNHFGCCSKPILEWISKNIRGKCIVNLMNQYRPEYRAHEYEDINRRITREEFGKVINYAKKLRINYIT